MRYEPHYALLSLSLSLSLSQSPSLSMCVCRGKSYVNTSMEIEDLPELFVSEKAPRTVIALDTNGTLFLIQVTK